MNGLFTLFPEAVGTISADSKDAILKGGGDVDYDVRVPVPRASKETRERVLLAAKELNYRPSKAALGVKIVRLRKKLIAAGATGQPLNVIRNWGYQLSVPISLT